MAEGLRRSLPFGFVASRGVEIARVASSIPSLPFNFAPSTTFPSCRIGRYNILIGSNDGSSLAVKVTFSLSRSSSAKFRKSAELQDLVNPGFTEKRGKRGAEIPFAGFSINPGKILHKSRCQTAPKPSSRRR
ncbi:hypothetical protein M5K25_018867 [Dendrobium thyrsiflorum]|uniref:Uncharacterized protein n=1 Tax=Dendrobium thyrsiflorum TaxID=117978 RepID=A0ABD0UK70_DENTH